MYTQSTRGGGLLTAKGDGTTMGPNSPDRSCSYGLCPMVLQPPKEESVGEGQLTAKEEDTSMAPNSPDGSCSYVNTQPPKEESAPDHLKKRSAGERSQSIDNGRYISVLRPGGRGGAAVAPSEQHWEVLATLTSQDLISFANQIASGMVSG